MHSEHNGDETGDPEIEYMPSCNCGTICIALIVGIGSIIIIFSDKSPATLNDGNKVFEDHEFYRLITSMWSVFSLTDIIFLLVCLIWLPFLTSEYERKYSTVYLLYHFLRTHMMIQLLVGCIFKLLFVITTMKNFIQISAGILPYCLYMWLQKALMRPCESVNYWFCPFPMSRACASFCLGLFLMFWSPESQGCLVVMAIFMVRMLAHCILNKCRCNSSMVRVQGPYFWFPIKMVEACIPGCIKRWDRFISVYDVAENPQESIQHSQTESQIKV